MFTVREVPGAIPRLVLCDEDARSAATVAPARGGMLTAFHARGREWLFLDEETFADPSKNVRGGNPVLFPSPGKLEGDQWSRAGKSGRMPQHGFARNRAWREKARGTDGSAWVALELADDAVTREQFPWPFRVELRYALAGNALRIDIHVENPGREPLPFGFGFHPYFRVPQAEKAQSRVPTKATRAWDNVQKREVPFAGIDLSSKEVDLHLEDHGGSAAQLELPDGIISLRGSSEFQRWVIWTLQGRDFVCVEPWTCPGNALNTGRGLLELAPGDERKLSLELAVEPR